MHNSICLCIMYHVIATRRFRMTTWSIPFSCIVSVKDAKRVLILVNDWTNATRDA